MTTMAKTATTLADDPLPAWRRSFDDLKSLTSFCSHDRERGARRARA
jgi:hypothetical protein